MPVVDDFARAQPEWAAPAAALDIVVSARAMRAAAVRAWMLATWSGLGRLVGRS